MSVVSAIREMLSKGLSIEQALTAAELIENHEVSQLEVRRANDRARKAAQRSRDKGKGVSRDEVTGRHVTIKKQQSNQSVGGVTGRHVTPPKDNISNPPVLFSDADASLVNEPVDACRVVIEKPRKNLEALRAFGEAWNQLAGSLNFPPIDEIKTGSTRERQALARLREMPPNGIQELMARIRGSPYLRGEVNGFRVSFDWIIKPSNYQKIMEGNYEARKVTTFRR